MVYQASFENNFSRCALLAPDCWVAKKAVPICTASAPKAIAAFTPRASAIPPAAITGIFTASTTCGINENVPIKLSSALSKKETR